MFQKVIPTAIEGIKLGLNPRTLITLISLMKMAKSNEFDSVDLNTLFLNGSKQNGKKEPFFVRFVVNPIEGLLKKMGID